MFFPRCDLLRRGIVSPNSTEVAWIGALHDAIQARGGIINQINDKL